MSGIFYQRGQQTQTVQVYKNGNAQHITAHHNHSTIILPTKPAIFRLLRCLHIDRLMGETGMTEMYALGAESVFDSQLRVRWYCYSIKNFSQVIRRISCIITTWVYNPSSSPAIAKDQSNHAPMPLLLLIQFGIISLEASYRNHTLRPFERLLPSIEESKSYYNSRRNS